MRGTWSVGLVVAAVLGALATGSPVARGQDVTEQAKAEFKAGVSAFDANDFAGALRHFQEAYRLKPHPMVRVNMANCYDKLGRPLEAIFHFEQFLEAKAGNASQRREVAAALARLRKRIGKVRLEIAPDGARVQIDGGEVRRAPVMEPVSLEAGSHSVSVSLDGFQPVTRRFNVGGGDSPTIRISLDRATPPAITQAPAPPPAVAPAQPAPAPAPAPGGVTPTAPTAPPAPTASAPPAQPAPATTAAAPTAEPSGPGLGPFSTRVWVAGGATAGVLVLGVITGILALDAESDFEEFARLAEPGQGQGSLAREAAWNEAADASDRARGLALATDILLTAAIVGGGATVLLYALDEAEDQTGTVLVPSLGPGHAGARLSGRF